MSRPVIGTDVFRAVAHEHRRHILELLRVRERSPGELLDAVHVSGPTLSRHLRALETAGLVLRRPLGGGLRYRLNRRRLAVLNNWLRRMTPAGAGTSSAER